MLIDQGKIRAWGSSNETCWGVMKNLWEAEKHGLARMASVQNNFSLINRRCESELAQVCRQENVSLLPYSPLGGGVLTAASTTAVRCPKARASPTTSKTAARVRNAWRPAS
jgi:aryl-alcohol dehydrogenase-like predicted oxidoreductase